MVARRRRSSEIVKKIIALVLVDFYSKGNFFPIPFSIAT